MLKGRGENNLSESLVRQYENKNAKGSKKLDEQLVTLLKRDGRKGTQVNCRYKCSSSTTLAQNMLSIAYVCASFRWSSAIITNCGLLLLLRANQVLAGSHLVYQPSLEPPHHTLISTGISAK